MKRIKLKVVTNAKVNRVLQDGESLIVRTTAKPVQGEANKVVVALVSDYMNIAKSKIAIIQGTKDKHKTIEIDD